MSISCGSIKGVWVIHMWWYCILGRLVWRYLRNKKSYERSAGEKISFSILGIGYFKKVFLYSDYPIIWSSYLLSFYLISKDQDASHNHCKLADDRRHLLSRPSHSDQLFQIYPDDNDPPLTFSILPLGNRWWSVKVPKSHPYLIGPIIWSPKIKILHHTTLITSLLVSFLIGYNLDVLCDDQWGPEGVAYSRSYYLIVKDSSKEIVLFCLNSPSFLYTTYIIPFALVISEPHWVRARSCLPPSYQMIKDKQFSSHTSPHKILPRNSC